MRYENTRNEFTVTGHHRSKAHAVAAALDIRRQYNAFEVNILERRNSKGQYSKRGHSFTFEVIRREEPEDEYIEFDGGVDYHGEE